jgi:chaperonin GroES
MRHRFTVAMVAGAPVGPPTQATPSFVGAHPRGRGEAAGCHARGAPLAFVSRRLDMANIRPLHDRVIVKRVKEEEKTKGGIIIPDTAKEKPIEGEVIAVGNGKILEDGSLRKLDVKAGDRILFGKYSGTEVKVDGEERLILREDDILGVLEK